MQNFFRIAFAGFLSNFFLIFFNPVSAQRGTIQGLIRDTGNRSVPYANVLLLKFPDSSLVRGIIADSLGKYVFDHISEGEYFISISQMGFDIVYSELISINRGKHEIDEGIIHLSLINHQLKEITVSARKPMFEQKADRTVINVRNSITSAGGSALEVLEKSPGISINRQDNSIAINGKSGVSVMINGKISYMPADALIQFLSGVNAGNIERIELITTPPSKYDAGGNGGYINIMMINNPYAGLNGSYFLTAGYGSRPLGAAGLNFNYRSGKINLYGDYSFTYNHTIQTSTAFTQFDKSGASIMNNSYSDRDAITQVHNIRLGADYQTDPANIVGVLLSGYSSHWSMIAQNGVTTRMNNIPDTTIKTVDNPEINLWQNISVNVNYQHVFKPGKILYFDLNYIYYKDNNPNTYFTDYFDRNNKYLFHEDVRGGKITPIHFQVYSSDYTTSLGKNITMETGAKLSLSNFTNDVRIDYLHQGIWVPDSNLTVNYILHENIGAAYASFNISPGSQIAMTIGLRYEYTSSNLGSGQKANMISRKYGELFPTLYISKKISPDNSVNFSYSRRITRPTFNDLAPFTIFFDPKTFYSGNPALQPAIANAVQAGYAFKKYNFTISYTYENSTIDNFYFQTQSIDTIKNVVYLSARNFLSEQYLTASISVPVNVTRWWNMQNNITGNWVRINTAYEKIPVVLKNFNFDLNSIQRFTLPNEVAIEISGFYSSPAFMGTAKRKAIYQVNAGVQKRIGRKNDLLRLSANDIFNSGSYFRFVDYLPAADAVVGRNFSFGLVAYKVTYTHNFGNKALKEKRERSTGAEDELRRVHN
jgi:outer membrane receptor protein involved in Fe transport